MREWTAQRIEVLFRHRLFELQRHELAAGESSRQSLVLSAPNWVNVIPLLADGRVLLVRQWRFGIGAPTLEIPGGMVEDEPEEAAAMRELREETGYVAAHWQRLGEVEPNPAFLTNRCGTWLATDLEWVEEPRGDGEEEITVETAALEEIPALVASGAIRHALVVAAFYLLGLKRG